MGVGATVVSGTGLKVCWGFGSVCGAVVSDMVGNVGGTDCPGTAGGIVGGEGVSGKGARVRRRSGRKLGVGGTDGTDRGGKVRGVEVGGTVTVDSVKPFPLTVVVTRTGSES